jgi:small-conductance mechanosensitive channel
MSTQVTNWTYSNEQARVDINVTITFDSDARRAQEVMLAAAKAHSRCLKKPEPVCHLLELNDLGQKLTLSFWIPDVKEGRLAPQSDVLLAIVDGFRRADIALAARAGVPA